MPPLASILHNPRLENPRTAGDISSTPEQHAAALALLPSYKCSTDGPLLAAAVPLLMLGAALFELWAVQPVAAYTSLA